MPQREGQFRSHDRPRPRHLLQLLDLQKARAAVVILPGTEFERLDGEQQLEEYRFKKGRIRHTFCRDKQRGDVRPRQAYVRLRYGGLSVRCLDDTDLARLNPVPFDGKSV